VITEHNPKDHLLNMISWTLRTVFYNTIFSAGQCQSHIRGIRLVYGSLWLSSQH